MSSPSHKTAIEHAVNVTVNRLCKSFGDHQVLSEVSFTVNAGEIFTIMGPSGSGKSVLLRHIIGLEHPDSGEALIAGHDASDPATHKRINTGMVFQAGALFNSMSVFDNLALYPIEHRLYDKETVHRKVHEALNLVSLGSAAQKIPAELSGGMRKRVAVARALVMEPQLLLYDEPTSELDPILAATIAELIATVRDQTGLTSIIVTHDKELATSISDRIAILLGGRIHTVATPSELKSSDDPEVQEFLNPIIDPANPRFRK